MRSFAFRPFVSGASLGLPGAAVGIVVLAPGLGATRLDQALPAAFAGRLGVFGQGFVGGREAGFSGLQGLGGGGEDGAGPGLLFVDRGGLLTQEDREEVFLFVRLALELRDRFGGELNQLVNRVRDNI